MAAALRSILGDDVNVPSDLEPDSSGLVNSDDIFYRIPVSSDSDSAPFAQTPALLPPPPQTPNFPSQDPQIPENPTENSIPLQLQASSTIGENHVQGMEAQTAAALATCDSAPPGFKREPRDVISKPKRRPYLGWIGAKDDNDFVILEPMPYEGQEESRGAHGRRESRWDEKLSPTQHLFPLPFNGQTAIPLPSQVLPVPVSEPIGNPSECLLLKNLFDPATKTDPEFDLDIKDDVEEECSKFGRVRHIRVDRHSDGHVYLRFDNKEDAMSAQREMHVRWFARRLISAIFVPPQDYERKFPDVVVNISNLYLAAKSWNMDIFLVLMDIFGTLV